jgi:hypothetical protein
MSMKKYKLEAIVNLLWQVEVKIAHGKTTPPGSPQNAEGVRSSPDKYLL